MRNSDAMVKKYRTTEKKKKYVKNFVCVPAYVCRRKGKGGGGRGGYKREHHSPTTEACIHI